MNSDKRVLLLAAAVLAVTSQAAQAVDIGLTEWRLNIDQNVYVDGAGLPATVTTSAFNPITGLGSLTVTLANQGNHYVGAFFDHEIDEVSNTFFNEIGTAVGTPMAGLSWEIDEPGYVSGDIVDNFTIGMLDNAAPGMVDDVSMALGWDFVLNQDETATVHFVIGQVVPASGFYLRQYDPDSDAALYFSSTLNISGGGTPPIPEPATGLLLGAGLTTLVSWRRWHRLSAARAQ